MLEHVAEPAALIEQYLPLLVPGGRIVLITPQEAGWRSDATHVRFLDDRALVRILEALGFGLERAYSFPFPRWAGRAFRYNEFVVVGRQVATTDGSAPRPPRPITRGRHRWGRPRSARPWPRHELRAQ